MIKNFTLALVGILLLSQAHAQNNPLQLPVSAYPSQYFESINQMGVDAAKTVAPFQKESVQPIPSNNRGLAALWAEDFGNGWPTGWVADNASGLCPWKWSTNGSYGFFETNATSYGAPINSTTAGNGFLISDLDSANHFNFGQPSGTTYQFIDTYFATTEIDLGASYGSLLLEFQQSFRFNNSVDLVVEVSVDSTNWTQYNVQGGVQNNDASDDPDLVSLNISGAVGNSQTLFLRIGWNARVYYWMIDDMQILEGDNYDLVVNDVWHGDILGALEYEKIPLPEVQEVVIGVASLNNGGLTQTGVSYEYDITQDGTSVANGVFDASNMDIASSEGDTTFHATGFTPSELGEYEVLITVSGDSVEPNLTNNTFSSDFEVTQFVYGHDEEDDITLQVSGGDDSSGEPNEYKIGLLYEVVEDGILTGIETAFGFNTETTECFVEVYNASENPDLDDPIYVEVFDFTPSQVTQGFPIELVNIPIDGGDGVEVIAGDLYLVAIGTASEGDDLWVLASEGDDDAAQLRYGPFGVGGAVDWYTGYTTSPILRADFNISVGVEESKVDQDVFSVYPNPANETIQLKFNSTDVNQVRLTDATGKLAAIHSLVSGSVNFQMDVSDLSRGVYFLSVVSESSVATEKLVIE